MTVRQIPDPTPSAPRDSIRSILQKRSPHSLGPDHLTGTILPEERLLRSARIALPALLVLLPAAAAATPVEWRIGGTIAEVVDPDGFVFGSRFQVGLPFSGSLRWDTGMNDQDPDPAEGDYVLDPALGVIEISLQLAGESFSSDPDELGVLDVRDDALVNNAGLDVADRLAVVSHSPLSSLPSGLGSPQVLILEIILLGVPSAFSGDAPPQELELADWIAVREVNLVGSRRGSPALVTGEIQTITEVPEAGTGLLVTLALGLAANRRRARPPQEPGHDPGGEPRKRD